MRPASESVRPDRERANRVAPSDSSKALIRALTAGWLNAIRRAQVSLHRGIDIGAPTLVLRSTRSGKRTEASDRVDLVIDTAQIAQWESSLGIQVTDAPVKDARHDVFLSVPESRASAYGVLGNWLERQQLWK